MDVAFSTSFRKKTKKLFRKNKLLEEKFWRKTETFIDNPYSPSLKTHKLSGELQELSSFSVEQDCRVIFYFETNAKVVFIDIGTHDEVY